MNSEINVASEAVELPQRPQWLLGARQGLPVDRGHFASPAALPTPKLDLANPDLLPCILLPWLQALDDNVRPEAPHVQLLATLDQQPSVQVLERGTAGQQVR